MVIVSLRRVKARFYVYPHTKIIFDFSKGQNIDVRVDTLILGESFW
jgi:hypothetical protein